MQELKMKHVIRILEVWMVPLVISCTAEVSTDSQESYGDTEVGKLAQAVMACEMFTATNDQHVSAGRAYQQASSFWFLGGTNYLAVGSDESLGTSGIAITTLYEIDEGAFSQDKSLCNRTTTTNDYADSSCLDGITNYSSRGPFTFKTRRSGSVNMYIPNVPSGCKVPMIHHANGTGATCSMYGAALERLASHGFLTLCYESTNTGAGNQGITAFETALREYPNLAALKFGSTGHSQGGQASFIVLQYAEEKWGSEGVYAGLAQEPASGFGTQPAWTTWQRIYAKIKSPMFMFSGLGTDGLVAQSWVQSAFNALSNSTEAYFWAKTGATHIPVPNGETQEISVPWFRWKLLGDQKACEAFKRIPTSSFGWLAVDEQNAQRCN